MSEKKLICFVCEKPLPDEERNAPLCGCWPDGPCGGEPENCVSCETVYCDQCYKESCQDRCSLCDAEIFNSPEYNGQGEAICLACMESIPKGDEMNLEILEDRVVFSISEEKRNKLKESSTAGLDWFSVAMKGFFFDWTGHDSALKKHDINFFCSLVDRIYYLKENEYGNYYIACMPLMFYQLRETGRTECSAIAPEWRRS